MSLSVGMTKTCPYCGAPLAADATRCNACGALMPDAPAHGAPADGRARGALNADALQVLQTEGKIQAIKFVRQKTGLGLKEAKEYVEAVEQGRDPGPVQPTPPKTGCGTAAAIAFALVITGIVLRFFLA